MLTAATEKNQKAKTPAITQTLRLLLLVLSPLHWQGMEKKHTPKRLKIRSGYILCILLCAIIWRGDTRTVIIVYISMWCCLWNNNCLIIPLFPRRDGIHKPGSRLSHRSIPQECRNDPPLIKHIPDSFHYHLLFSFSHCKYYSEIPQGNSRENPWSNFSKFDFLSPCLFSFSRVSQV